MNKRLAVRARAAWLCGVALTLAGLLGVLYFVALLGWQWTGALQTKSWISLPATLSFLDHATLRDHKAAPVLEWLPQLPPAWLSDLEAWPVVQQVVATLLGRMHVGLVPALVGVIVMALGARIALRQNAVLNAAQRERQDRLRRVRLYRNIDARQEPYLGPSPVPFGQADPSSHDARRTTAGPRRAAAATRSAGT